MALMCQNEVRSPLGFLYLLCCPLSSYFISMPGNRSPELFRVPIYLWYLDESAYMVGVEDGGGGGWWGWMWSKIAWGWEGNLGNLQLFSVQIFHPRFLSAPDLTSVTCFILGLQAEAFSWFQIKSASFFKILPAGPSLLPYSHPQEAHRCWPNPFC